MIDFSLVLTLQLAATFFMCGLIWCVQLVHYPLMNFVQFDRFVEFERAHMRRISLIVMPAMILEILSAGASLLLSPQEYFSRLTLAAAALLMIWVSTGALQVPLHDKLSRGFEPHAHRALVRTNWIRTFLWTLRSALLFSIVLYR